MNFGSLLGNESLKQRLSATVSGGKLPHSFLLCGPEGSGKHTLAALLAATFECTAEGERPCQTCHACKKVFAGIHPDVITIDDPSKKSVSVKLVRDLQSDIIIAPNEGQRKIYILPRAQDMTDEAQNALLKIMEEPPAYGVFLLLTTNPNMQLPTIRSRAVELRLSPLRKELLLAKLHQQFPNQPEEAYEAAWYRSGGYLGQAIALMDGSAELAPETHRLVQALCRKTPLALAQALIPLEKYKRDQLLPLLTQWNLIAVQALSVQAGLPAAFADAKELASCRSGRELAQIVRILKKAQAQVEGNVGIGHIMGALVVLFSSNRLE